jgi:Protein of unknown function (DUF3043)
VFRRKSAGAPDGTAQDSQGDKRPGSAETTKTARSPAEAAKGRPTPKRSEAERGRRQPLGGPAGRKTSGGSSRPPAKVDRARKYDAMKAGEEWALAAKDKGPVKALARDYVDSRRLLSEYYMYVLILLLAVVFIRKSQLQTLISPLILVLAIVVAVEGWFTNRRLRKLIAERLPGESTRGVTRYAIMRGLQIRKLRMPAPRVRPGEKI